MDNNNSYSNNNKKKTFKFAMRDHARSHMIFVNIYLFNKIS